MAAAAKRIHHEIVFAFGGAQEMPAVVEMRHHPRVLIGLVGLSYLLTVGLAYFIGDLRANSIGVSFIGDSEFTDPTSHRKMKMESFLQMGYWYALYAGVALVVLSIVRFLFVRK